MQPWVGSVQVPWLSSVQVLRGGIHSYTETIQMGSRLAELLFGDEELDQAVGVALPPFDLDVLGRCHLRLHELLPRDLDLFEEGLGDGVLALVERGEARVYCT